MRPLQLQRLLCARTRVSEQPDNWPHMFGIALDEVVGLLGREETHAPALGRPARPSQVGARRRVLCSTQRVTFAEAGQRYLVRPQGLAAGDVERLADLNEILGDLPITELMGEAGWPRFIRERCQGLAPATIDRFGDVLRAAFNAAAEEPGYAPPKIKRLAALVSRHRDIPASMGRGCCGARMGVT